jgi:hypothetical protein
MDRPTKAARIGYSSSIHLMAAGEFMNMLKAAK